jgi:hypothetical protein
MKLLRNAPLLLLAFIASPSLAQDQPTEAQRYPCAHQEKFQEFDFWIGDWDVHTADGTQVGRNSIKAVERGCALIENWTDANGNTGMSMNYIDKTTDEWVQVWMAEGGSQILIRGGLTDDGMLLEGTIHYVSNGLTHLIKGLWTPMPDGRVRQFFEHSTDDGESWSSWFEGFYTRQTDKTLEIR